jgi:hypothetical protein
MPKETKKMLTLANNTHIMFMSEIQEHDKYPYCGWNTMGNLVSVLAHRFGEYPQGHPVKTMEAIQSLREKGFLTPEECGDSDSLVPMYWIVEKAIPMDIRGTIREQAMKVQDVIKELRV